jgi:hypothetical protein
MVAEGAVMSWVGDGGVGGVERGGYMYPAWFRSKIFMATTSVCDALVVNCKVAHLVQCAACSDKNGQVWFAKVLGFVTFKGSPGQLGERAVVDTPGGKVVHVLAAYVEWYAQVPHTKRTAHVRLARHERPQPNGGTFMVNFTDVIPVRDISRPVFLQRDPTAKKKRRWFYNPFVV